MIDTAYAVSARSASVKNINRTYAASMRALFKKPVNHHGIYHLWPYFASGTALLVFND
jgi:hypothetical protein